MNAPMVLRADGRIEHLPNAPTATEAATLIGADALDGFSLRDGRYVYLDDQGHSKKLPRNAAATALYLAICLPGTTHYIAGDVVIVRQT